MLSRSDRPADIADAVHRYRNQAGRFRERRAELDSAIQGGSERELDKLNAALHGDARRLSSAVESDVGKAGVVAGEAASLFLSRFRSP